MKHLKENKEKLEVELKQIRSEISSQAKVEVEALQKHENDEEKISSLFTRVQDLEQVFLVVVCTIRVVHNARHMMLPIVMMQGAQSELFERV